MQIEQLLIILVPMVTGLVAVVKELGLPSRFAPIASIAIGIGISMLQLGNHSLGSVFVGILVGLSASGLYSGVKKTTLG